MSNAEDLIMESKQQDNKPAKTQPMANLPIVTLTDKDMSHISGGGKTK